MPIVENSCTTNLPEPPQTHSDHLSISKSTRDGSPFPPGALSAAVEGVLTPEPSGDPFLFQQARSSSLNTPVCSAQGMVPPIGGNHRRNPPLLSVQTRGRRKKRNPTGGPRLSARQARVRWRLSSECVFPERKAYSRKYATIFGKA